jgi:H/ACA ribonucleoprotein complex subunit 1
MLHECESEMVCKLIEKESKIPHFNAGIYLENKKKIGKVDEVCNMRNYIKLSALSRLLNRLNH